MPHLPDLWQLTWNDLDPAGRSSVDPAGLAAIVRSLPPAAEVPPAGTDWRLTDFWYDQLTRALADRLGIWVAGWRYTSATDATGPYWRAERPPVTTPEETLGRFTDAVLAWHEVLTGFSEATWPVAASRRSHYPSHPRRLPHPSQLSWAEIDAVDFFDPDTVRTEAAAAVAATPPPARDADWRLVGHWLETVTVGFADRYGRWVVGWRWSTGEGDLDGGPIGNWCCFAHSATTPEATAEAIAASLLEWRDWLDELAERFDRYLPMAPGDLDGWERAVAHLITAVGDRTQYDSGWYGCCRTVLGWFLEAAGIELARRAELLTHAIGGRFQSWVEPPRMVVESVAETLARRVTVDRA
ncbi:hypothetical protein JIG36_05255 [Actinoplanes sp. LDG1-06]|uniref:Uncharacterized protein n=1 Tax=Paractinoplanes ovalisporus TaxID=2810368 RepID=A0ABS2A559_9ACTN|nr:hypothetical protein [Actinoplanes ovalisporus]MBM2614966.1 hypothetical protein [Actinoplanes ovalisporus]